MQYTLTPIQPFGVCIQPKRPNSELSVITIKALKQLFIEHQLVLLRGFKTFANKDEFAHYCDEWGEVSLWPFGKVLELIEQDSPADHIFDNSYVPMHWDGMYRPFVPEYQIFHCVTAPPGGCGGQTIFSNTKHVLEGISPRIRALWNKVTGIYQREMDFYDSRTVSPLVTKHPYHDYDVIRYNEPHREENGQLINPPNIQFEGLAAEEIGQLQETLYENLYAPENCYTHDWKKKDVVIADNFTLLHGRAGFTSRSPRYIQRIQVESSTPYKNSALKTYQ